jgi:hypothetical protein
MAKGYRGKRNDDDEIPNFNFCFYGKKISFHISMLFLSTLLALFERKIFYACFD